MNKITENIWIGNSQDARNLGQLKQDKINAILNCAFDLDNKIGWSQGFHLAHCGLVDGPGNHLSAYYSGIFQLANLIKLNRKVLVHCHAGASRSVSIAIMYLHAIDPQGWDYWRTFIREKRVIPDDHPRFPHKEAFDKLNFEYIRNILL